MARFLLDGFRKSVLKERREGVRMKFITRNIDALLSKRANLFTRVTGMSLSLFALCSFAVEHESHGQQLRDVFRTVQRAVVIVRTEQIGLAPYPQQGLVSSNGLGSGVLISNDRVLTAAHLVESADRTVVDSSFADWRTLLPKTKRNSRQFRQELLVELQIPPFIQSKPQPLSLVYPLH
jgi:hypothetical protein